MKTIMIVALAALTSNFAHAGGGGGQSPGPRRLCGTETKILDSKTVRLRGNAGSMKLELEENLVICNGALDSSSISVLLKMVEGDESGANSDVLMVATESHGNMYDPSTNPKSRRIGSSGALLNFCFNGKTSVRCSRRFVSSSVEKTGEHAPVNTISSNDYEVKLVGDALPLTVLRAAPRE